MVSSLMLDGAALLARHGLHVVKLHYPIWNRDDNTVRCSCGNDACASKRSVGKHPVGAQWGKSATTDLEVIEETWRSLPWNVGILLGLGHGIDPGQAVIDIEDDTIEGRNLAEALLKDYPTVTWSSGKSLHRLYRWRAGLPDVASLTISGLEIRLGGAGKETQSVAPPSRHYGGLSYEWVQGRGLGEIAIASLPDHVVDWINEEYGRQQSVGVSGPGGATSHRAFRRVGQKVQAPGRNNALHKHACACWRDAFRMYGINGLEEQETRDKVWMWVMGGNLMTCDPPLDEDEAWSVYLSAERFMKPELAREAEERWQKVQAEADPAAAVAAVVQAEAETVAAAGEIAVVEERQINVRSFVEYLAAAGLRIVRDPGMSWDEICPDRIDVWECDWTVRYLLQAEREVVMLGIGEHEVEVTEQDMDKPAVLARKIYQGTQGKVQLDRTFAAWSWKTIWSGRANKGSDGSPNGVTRGLREWVANAAQVQQSAEKGLAGLVMDVISGLVGPVSTIADGVEQYTDHGAPIPPWKDRLKLNPNGELVVIGLEGEPISGVYQGGSGEGLWVVVKSDEVSQRFGKSYGRGKTTAADLSRIMEELGFEYKKLRSGRPEGRVWRMTVEKFLENFRKNC